MQNISTQVFDIGMMDRLASGGSAIHRLDARAKVIVTFAFCLSIVSFDKYAVAPLVAFALYPAIVVSAAGLPWRYLLKKLIMVSPFAIMVGIFNPMLDREPLVQLGSIVVTGGWVSFSSIIARFGLTVLAVLVLLTTTGINGVCRAMDRLGFPQVFTVQIMFLYRYLFLLSDEAQRISRARTVRGPSPGIPDIRIFIRLVGTLLVRAIARAHRVYAAMESRGFDGHIRNTRRSEWGKRESVYVLCCLASFILLRFSDVVGRLGQLTLELIK